MLRTTYSKYILNFKQPAGTSRETLNDKETWFIKIGDEKEPQIFGLGECALFRGLSCDDKPEYERTLSKCCLNINNQKFLDETLPHWPSICFGIESAMADLKNGGKRLPFQSSFTEGVKGIPINGLIWMGTQQFVNQQVKEKLEAGFRCLKFKVSATNLNDELYLLHTLRKEFAPSELEIRLDANGAFTYTKALEIIEKFSKFHIHSIEQPIKAGHMERMAYVCENSTIPIALDEELIGITDKKAKKEILEVIRPHYIILKPALVGGFSGAKEWIHEATKLKIGWWVTSALESNIGLNAIAQWTYKLNNSVTQGLGTGSLYTNNIPSPLQINGQYLFYNTSESWDISNILFHG